MRFKPVPTPPPTLDDVDAVRSAIPDDPGPETDCCGSLVERIAWIEDREEAAEWLVFLRALELVTESDGLYRSTDTPVDRDQLAGRFSESIVGADAVLDALGETPQPVDTIVAARAPATHARASGRHRDETNRPRDEDEGHQDEDEDDGPQDEERDRSQRTRRLLEWAVRFDLATRTGNRYRER